MMPLAERKRLISRNPFLEVDFLKQKNQRQPHILTFRRGGEALGRCGPLPPCASGFDPRNRDAVTPRGAGSDVGSNQLRQRFDSSPGIEDASGHQKYPAHGTDAETELVRWREMHGPKFSPFVFPNIVDPCKTEE